MNIDFKHKKCMQDFHGHGHIIVLVWLEKKTFSAEVLVLMAKLMPLNKK